MAKHDIGLVGLAVMGQNLALNIANHGFLVAVFNRTESVTRRFASARIGEHRITPFFDMPDLVASLERPRRILLMVKAGPAVDDVVADLVPNLDPDDILIDCGNSHFADTEKRTSRLLPSGIRYLGMGVSGGEEGALRGPSLMPGGDRDAFEAVSPVLEAIAARAADDSPCVAYLGPGGSGHFVKMVHNGIEYALMQSIAEAYDVMHRGLRCGNDEISDVFASWNLGVLSSFLVEITAVVLRKVDPETGGWMVDLVLDRAEQKGTGRWTVESALEAGVPIPSIGAAVDARGLSAYRKERMTASEILKGPRAPHPGERQGLIEALHDALYASFVMAYAQGFHLIAAAGGEHAYPLDAVEIARIWRAGCIIRASLLEDIAAAMKDAGAPASLITTRHFARELQRRQDGWREALAWAVAAGIPTPSISASLAYYDSYRSARLPANLIQAQRDCFGAHMYRRVDKEGTFHSQWMG